MSGIGDACHFVGALVFAGGGFGSRFRFQRHFHIAFDGIRSALWMLISEFDDGDCFEHRPGHTSRSTLPGPPSGVSRTIALGMTMGANCTGNDDGEKQNGDNASDAI